MHDMLSSHQQNGLNGLNINIKDKNKDKNKNKDINSVNDNTLDSSIFNENTYDIDSNISVTETSIHNNFNQRKILVPVSNIILENNRNSKLISKNNNNNNNQTNQNNLKSLDCSSFIDSSNSTPNLSSSNLFSNNDNKFLSDLYSTPEFSTFDSPISGLNTPITPISPEFYSNKNQPINLLNNSFIRYPLNDNELEKFILNSNLFSLKLDDKIGKGSNAYVYSCELSTIGIQNSSFNIAVKIPISKNKVKYIIQEAKFAIKLRNYQDEWFKNHNTFYPFIDCYGIYYLNKDQFSLFKKNDELPCLLMKKMTIGLTDFINNTNNNSSTDDTKLSIKLWWELCKTLLDALTILKTLKCVHSDLKTDNIMVLQTNNNTNNILFKVIDFSSACEIDKLTKCPDMTLQYTAPELLDFTKKRLPTYQTDLFSAGLVLLEAATGSKPYSSAGYDHFYLLTVIKEGKVMDWLSPEDLNILKANPEIHNILYKILIERCSLEEISDYVSQFI